MKYQCWLYDVNIYLICELYDEQYMFSGIHVKNYSIINVNYTMQARVKVRE